MMNVRRFGKSRKEVNLIKLYDERLGEIQGTAEFHGDKLVADKIVKSTGLPYDVLAALSPKALSSVLKILGDKFTFKSVDNRDVAQIIGALPNNSKKRSELTERRVEELYNKMLHPPLTYLGDAFQYRAPDGKFNSALNPSLGQAGAPYAKTVPSKTHPLGALPDPGDVFDRLMAREKGGRNSDSGLSSMLIYHAIIIIHDIFRTNECDKNISDSSSYLDLSPLYGYSMQMQRKVRDDKFKLGLLKPDTFAEERLLRLPPGVCIMLVMYNRYHNYAATQLKRINENGRFQIPAKFKEPKLLAAADQFITGDKRMIEFAKAVNKYKRAWDLWSEQGRKPCNEAEDYETAERIFRALLIQTGTQVNGERFEMMLSKFEKAHDAAWDKLDDDLFNTARLITCGQYVNVSIHDYLRALIGFHQYDSTFTLDPRIAMTEHRNVSRGLGNQVTVEFNLLYRFHCAISQKDEKYTEDFMKETMREKSLSNQDPENLSLREFGLLTPKTSQADKEKPWLQEFGLKNSDTQTFKRNTITGLFDDQQMINQLLTSMDDPISNFGPRNVPKALKNVEIMGILQARKWEIGTLNDFRDFFGLGRHETFEQITRHVGVQNALRDLYDHPDKVELYPGIFCESDETMNLDPGPKKDTYTLWSAIFSDAVTLVRSDRFYTVDWNTNSLTSWGMAEVTPDNNILKSSIFHRLLQRAFPGWFPYDSIRFFHPFYTGQTNARYAKEQGYASLFDVSGPFEGRYKIQTPEPKKPNKPLYLKKYTEIQAVLSKPANEIIHPAFVHAKNLPKKVAEALVCIQSKGTTTSKKLSDEDVNHIKMYFAKRTRAIVEREVIVMDKKKRIFQIDITRDVAIPVVTRCIADFLGFGEQIRDVKNPKAKYSENEIYQHITNCQVFLSYNTDETKLLKRQAAFKESMEFLLKLTERGNILEASRWGITKPLRIIGNLFKAKSLDNESLWMKYLGRSVAALIFKKEKDIGKAAAILLLTALDIAYISVLSFTSVLDHLLEETYALARDGGPGSCAWLNIQKSALEDDKGTDKFIEAAILEVQKSCIRMPFIRKVVKKGVKIGAKDEPLEKGQTIICDIYEAMTTEDKKEMEAINEFGHLNYFSSLSTGMIHFNPKDVAKIGLTTMIKIMAQMKNLRRGHTSQGIIKKVEIESSNEGYANFMAPGRMQMIKNDVEMAKTLLEKFRLDEKKIKQEKPMTLEEKEAKEVERKFLQQRVIDAEKKVYNNDILKPKADTFLTAEWNEMIPFPTTWKLRFEGYGASNYGGKDAKNRPLKDLLLDPLPDSEPPFYQPQGPSHYGGVFADPKDVPTKPTPAELTPAKSIGCGVPALVLHSAPEGLDAVQH